MDWQTSFSQICSCSLPGLPVQSSPLQLLTIRIFMARTPNFSGASEILLYASLRLDTPCTSPLLWLWEYVPVKGERLQQVEAAFGKPAAFLTAAFLWHHRLNRVWIFSWNIVGDAARWFRRKSCGRLELWVPFSAKRLRTSARSSAARSSARHAGLP